MDIKPIQTNNKGNRFRSRLEARWAVFLDALDVKWEYEKEGYELPSGWYLPDFWLPEWKTWLEVKPEGGQTDKSMSLAEELCKGTGYNVLVSDGMPKFGYQGACFFNGLYLLDYDEGNNASSTYQFLYEIEDVYCKISKNVDSKNLVELSRLMRKKHSELNRSCYNWFFVHKTEFAITRYPDGDYSLWCVPKGFSNVVMYHRIDNGWDGCELKHLPNFDMFTLYSWRHPFVHHDFDDVYIEESALSEGSFSAQYIVDCINIAKSARFEHGEAKAPPKKSAVISKNKLSCPAWAMDDARTRNVAPPIPFTRIDQKEWPKDLQKLLARLEHHWLCFTWPDMAIDHNLRSYGDIDACLEDIIQGMGWLDDANYTVWPCENRDCFWSGIRELSVRMVAIFGAEAAKKVGIPEDEWRPIHWEIRNGVIIAELWSFEDMTAQRSRIEDCTTFLKTTIRQLRL